MAYRRGTQSLEVEMARVQGYLEDASDELDGTFQQPGIISLVRNREVREQERSDAKERSDKRLATIVGLFSAIPVILKVGEHFHWW